MTDLCSTGKRFITESDDNNDSENGGSSTSTVTDYESHLDTNDAEDCTVDSYCDIS